MRKTKSSNQPDISKLLHVSVALLKGEILESSSLLSSNQIDYSIMTQIPVGLVKLKTTCKAEISSLCLITLLIYLSVCVCVSGFHTYCTDKIAAKGDLGLYRRSYFCLHFQTVGLQGEGKQRQPEYC